MAVEASRITGELFQGSAPPVGAELAKAGFDVVVLTAEEYQPSAWQFPGVEVLRLPMADVPLRVPPEQLKAISELARTIAFRLGRGARVLVTCRAGLNRSGLVVGTYLVQEAGLSPMDAVKTIRSRRSVLALNNPAFVHAIVVGLRPSSEAH